MSLRNNEPNPLAVFNMRRLAHLPPHFEKITFDIQVNEKNILDWLYEHTEGRFYFGGVSVPSTKNKFPGGYPTKTSRTRCVGFEVHSEASYFALFLPEINSINEFF